MDEQILLLGIGIGAILVGIAFGESLQWCVKNNTSYFEILGIK